MTKGKNRGTVSAGGAGQGRTGQAGTEQEETARAEAGKDRVLRVEKDGMEREWSGKMSGKEAGEMSGEKAWEMSGEMSGRTLRLGTRKSALALAQAKQAETALRQRFPAIRTEIVPMDTVGDRLHRTPLADFGGKGVFVSEFEEALTDGRIDAAVHSAKDLPMELADGLCLAAALPRGEPGDVLVTVKGRVRVTDQRLCWEAGIPEHGTEPGQFRIGTGSLRRKAQTERLFENVVCVPLRGNVDTRLRKLLAEECDGLILAAAGLERLGVLSDRRFDFVRLPEKEFLPAGGQGILALEARADSEFSEAFAAINDAAAFRALSAERGVLRRLGAGCHEAVGVYGWEESGRFFLRLMCEAEAEADGQRPALRYREMSGEPAEAEALAVRLAEMALGEPEKDESCVAAGQEKARQEKARQGKARQGKAGQEKARQGKAEAEPGRGENGGSEARHG